MGKLSLEHSKSEKLYNDELFLSKAFNVSARKFQRNCAMTLKGDAKFKGKLTCGLKNNLRNLLNFHAGSWKSWNLHFGGFLLTKAYKDLDEKVQKSYVLKSDTKFEEKTDSWFQKWHEEFGEF